jgi:hypothetical protein
VTDEVEQLEVVSGGPGRGWRGRTPLLRRLAALVAPVAADAGALIDDEELLDCARAVCGVFADLDAGGGLPRSVILDRARGPWSQQTLAGRIELFTKLGLLQTILDKKHQQRYVLNPVGLVGLLLIDRIAERGGVDELLGLLDRTRALIESGAGDRAAVAGNLLWLRTTLGVYADQLARLVATAPLAELIEERRYHNHTGMLDRIGELNELVTDRFPDLDAEAYRLVTEAQRYVDACHGLISRVLDEGAQRRDFSVLEPEVYLAAALTGTQDQLAEVFATVVFDPPGAWIDATGVLDAVTNYQPRRERRERPPEPVDRPPPDPLGDIAADVERQARRRALAAEQHLQGEPTRDLTATVRGLGWAAAARLLGDLFALDTDPGAPYSVELGDAVFVDPDGPVTYAAPLTLHAHRPGSADNPVPDQEASARG